MAEDYFDLVVVGGGSAGYAAARTAAAEGIKVAVVDGAETLGGLCILRGCMPSKALLATAGVANSVKRAHEFGLKTAGFVVDGKQIISRKNKHINDFAEYRQQQLTDGRFDLIRGTASFNSAQQLAVTMRDGGSMVLTFQYALIATGSNISKVEVKGLEEAGYLVSDDVLEMTEFPASMIVLGGGAIALELATYLAAIGVETTLIQRSDHLLSAGDEDVAKALERAMEDSGIKVFTGTSINCVSSESGYKTVEFECRGEIIRVSAEEILQALGRHPATDGLNLQVTGAKLHGKQLLASPSQQVEGCPHLFAAGDVCGPHEIVHIAIHQGEIAARNVIKLLHDHNAELETIDYRLRLFAVFTDPEVAVAGLSEKQAREAGIEYCVATYPFNDHGKSLVMEEKHGFVKLLAAKASGELLGGAVVGPHGSELIHEIIVAMSAKMTARELSKVPHYHPTLSEIWTYPAEELAEKN